ncbi:serine/threonine protein kinase [Planktothrix sp. FACHB-1355]|uniref:Serine/threonine protein kinase n=1 Tax=Aerosakkonema funiforme FACHB-1375 TaxID=2949571 RepID=A0A926ZKJ4_9CYAN|nr:protein kinase [Aerosakkonema funiforme]MBD2184071.1 serine/threonine protein kinase [Aerosakkonema funiforme FACHB-1375]MBD3560145.1 serine/threonine protein kinase [Planktothrix sp. FACHB-1355]
MSYCLNPDCPKPTDPLNIPNRICRHCGWEILLQERYRVIRQLGQGGFSKTFEVLDRTTPKVLKVLFNNHPKAVSLFRREAEILSLLDHPGIPKVDRDAYFLTLPRNNQQPLHCLVMEKIDGCNLEEWLLARNYQPITQAQAVDWLKQLVIILERVHQQEYFHRDIKPSNIMLRSDHAPLSKGGWGDLVLIDFGTAREISGTYLAKVGGGQNVTGIISTGYTPLEQVNGKAVPQSDFFALGRTLVYLLTGKPPNDFPEDPRTGELLWRKSAPQVTKPVADFIDYLMAPFPGNRPSSTQIIFQYIENIERHLSTSNIGTVARGIQTNLPEVSQQIPLPKIKKTRYKKLPKFATEFLAVNATLLLGFTGTQIYDYFSTNSPDWSYQRRPKRSEESHSAVAAEKQSNPLVITSNANNAIKNNLAETYLSNPYNTLLGHLSRVNGIAFSPDGEILASGSGDSTIKLWDISTGKQIRTLWGHLSGVSAIAFSPDGQTLASASADNTIKLWDVSTGKLLHTLIGHSGWVSSVAFSPDGQTIASGSYDHTIKIWDAKTGELRQTLIGHYSWVFAVAFSPDGQTIASGSFDNTIKLWNPLSGQQKQTLTGHSLRVRSLAFSPDGNLLVSGTGEGTIELWNVMTGQIENTLTGHEDAVTAIAFSPDGKKIASSGDSNIKIWDVTTGILLDNLSGHLDTVDAVAFSPQNLILASGSNDNTIKIWPLSQLQTGKF